MKNSYKNWSFAIQENMFCSGMYSTSQQRNPVSEPSLSIRIPHSAFRILHEEVSVSETIKIVVTDYIEPDLEWEREQLAKYPNVTFEYHQLKFAPQEELIAMIRDADVILVNMAAFTEDVIAALERTKLIIRHGVGYDNVDVAAATRKGIRVAYEPDYCAEEVAEHAVALMLAAYRKVFAGRQVLEESARKGLWDFARIYPVFQFKGKNIGIVGCGRIGSLVLRKLSGFEVNPLVCDPYLSEERQRELGIEVLPLENVLKEADIITIHSALNDETRHMFSEEQFRAMKETAYLVNTARGGLVDTEALIVALREKQIAGAAIDVYEKEPPDADSGLFQLDNVTLAPHLAWCSEEAGWSIREKILEDFVRFIEGQPPRFLINKELA